MDIVGVGDSDIDLMIKVDHLPGYDEKVRGELLGKYPGGVVGNFCSVSAKWGSNTGIITKVGEDEFGEKSVNSLKEHGVDTSQVIIDKNSSTYFCVVNIDATGEKALTLVETEALMPTIEEIDMKYIKRSEFCHLPTLDLEIAEYIAGSVSKDVKISLDVEPTSEGGIKEWSELFQKAHIIFLNSAGLNSLFSNDKVKNNARKILDFGPSIVIVTKGKDGAELFTEDEHFRVGGFNVKARDTTGAGDCFNGVFVSSLAQGYNLPSSLQKANAAAAMSIQKIGSRSGITTPDEVNRFLEEHDSVIK